MNNQETKNLELALDCLLNEDDAKANELLHEFFVSKARTIIEGFEHPDVTGDFEEEVIDGPEAELDAEETELHDDEADIDLDEIEGDEDRLSDLEDALEELQAEFAALAQQEEGEEEHEGKIEVDGDDVYIDGEDEISDEDEDDAALKIEKDAEELDAEEMNESVELETVKVPNEADAGSDKKSPVRDNAGKGGIPGRDASNLMSNSKESTSTPKIKVDGETQDVKNRVKGKASLKKEKADTTCHDDKSAIKSPLDGKVK